jgi:hypothetical protein
MYFLTSFYSKILHFSFFLVVAKKFINIRKLSIYLQFSNDELLIRNHKFCFCMIINNLNILKTKFNILSLLNFNYFYSFIIILKQRYGSSNCFF